MKTNISIFALLFIFTISIQAQTIKGSGNIVTKSRTVTSFTKLNVSGHFNITLIKGNGTTLEIKAEDNLIDYITTEVKDGKLTIEFDKKYKYRTNKSITILVNFELLNSIALAGSGEIIGKDLIDSDNLVLSLAGSGKVKLDVSCTDLTSNIAGSGNIDLSGKTDVFNGNISGSGNIEAQALHASIVNTKIAGSGNIKVYAANEIHAQTSGSGNIIYYGDPTIIKANSSGSGSVRKKS